MDIKKNFINEQENIEKLCLPKENNNFELYGPNNNYGFASILKQYSGYPKDYPIMEIIPHAVYISDTILYSGELNSPLPGVFNYPPYRDKIWKKMARNKRVIQSASPVLYALKLFQPTTPKNQREGTLFYLPHSTHMCRVNFDKESVVEMLQNLPPEYHPITLSIHWYDVSIGIHHYFQSKGFNVVSAGHVMDEAFMFRWLNLVTQFRLTLSIDITSALFYSVAAGVPHQLFELPVEYIKHDDFKPDVNNNLKKSKQTEQRIKNLWRLFSDYRENVSEEQRDLVNFFLGADNLKSPQELIDEFNTVSYINNE